MPKHSDTGPGEEGPGRHFTTRRWFVTAAGFAVVSLYLVWAGYEAAPTSLSFLTEARAVDESGMVHGGGGDSGGMTPDKFRALTEAFVEKFELPDGSVKPGRHGMPEMVRAAGHGEENAHDDDAALASAGDGHDARRDEDTAAREGMRMGLAELTKAYRAFTWGEISAQAFAEVQRRANAALRATSAAAKGDRHGEAAPRRAMAEAKQDGAPPRQAMAGPDHDGTSAGYDESGPIDVYMMAMRYAYEPEVLRLEKDVPYRFRIMSMDANHGASINVGFAGHIMRRPARQMVEMTMTFTETGEYLVYCTVYCGLGHDMMKGKIIVE